MFTVEIKINGSLIQHIYGHNEGEDADGKTRYTFDLYDVQEQKLIKGEVKHHRHEGIRPLLTQIFKEVENEADNN